jgi:hypothetical protein
LGVEDLRSTLTEAISLAAESETFIDYVAQRRATSKYAEGHLEYLLDKASRSAKEVHQSAPEPAIQQLASECEAQLDSLVDSLRSAHQAHDDPERLQVAKRQVTSIRKLLETVRSSL